MQVLETLRGEKNLEQFTAEYDSLLKAVRKSHGEAGCIASVSETLDNTLLLRRSVPIVSYAAQT